MFPFCVHVCIWFEMHIVFYNSKIITQCTNHKHRKHSKTQKKEFKMLHSLSYIQGLEFKVYFRYYILYHILFLWLQVCYKADLELLS